MKHWIDRSVLGFWQDKEMRLEAAHLLDIADEVLEKQTTAISPFLGIALAQWFEGILQKERLAYRSRGGLPHPERVSFLLAPDQESLEWLEEGTGLTLLSVISTELRGELDHRQILGSLMGLGLKRELIGDIRQGLQGMVVVVVEEIAPYLLQEWNKAGRVSLRVERMEGTPELREDPGEERRITVASSRIDAVIAAGFNAARGVVQEWINQGKVKRNDLLISKADLEVKPGDVLSCRGQGRIRLTDTSATRKGRVAWTIILYRTQKR